MVDQAYRHGWWCLHRYAHSISGYQYQFQSQLADLVDSDPNRINHDRTGLQSLATET